MVENASEYQLCNKVPLNENLSLMSKGLNYEISKLKNGL